MGLKDELVVLNDPDESSGDSQTSAGDSPAEESKPISEFEASEPVAEPTESEHTEPAPVESDSGAEANSTAEESAHTPESEAAESEPTESEPTEPVADESDSGAEASDSESEAAEEEEEDEDEEDLVDPQDVLKEECSQKSECVALQEELNRCNERVAGKSNTTEDCAQELYDFVHCVDHCVAHTLFTKLK